MLPPELRYDTESVLHECESLSKFVEESLREQIRRRRVQQAFIERGLDARSRAQATGRYITKQDVMASLEAIVAKAR